MPVIDTAAELARIEAEQTATDTRTLAVVSGRPAQQQGDDEAARLEAELRESAA